MPCFGEPPLPLPLPCADDDLFSPGCVAAICPGGDISPTFEKPITMEKTVEDAKFIAQHVKNKDKFENVSIYLYRFRLLLQYFQWIKEHGINTTASCGLVGKLQSQPKKKPRVTVLAFNEWPGLNPPPPPNKDMGWSAEDFNMFFIWLPGHCP